MSIQFFIALAIVVISFFIVGFYFFGRIIMWDKVEKINNNETKKTFLNFVFGSIITGVFVLSVVYMGLQFDYIRKAKKIVELYDKGSPIAHNVLQKDLYEAVKSTWDVYYRLSSIEYQDTTMEEIIKPLNSFLWNSMIANKITLYKIDFSTEPIESENDFKIIRWDIYNWIEHKEANFRDTYNIEKVGQLKKEEEFRIWIDLGIKTSKPSNLHKLVKIFVRPKDTKREIELDIRGNIEPMGVKSGDCSFFMIRAPLKKEYFDENSQVEIITRYNAKQDVDFSLSIPDIRRYWRGIDTLNVFYYYPDSLDLWKYGCMDLSSLDILWSEMCEDNIADNVMIDFHKLESWGQQHNNIRNYVSYSFSIINPKSPPVFQYKQKLTLKNTSTVQQ